jgi:hypothetical protein
MLQIELRPAIHAKQGRLLEDVLISDNNAQPLTTAQSMGQLQELKFEALNHTAYSPALTLLDLYRGLLEAVNLQMMMMIMAK